VVSRRRLLDLLVVVIVTGAAVGGARPAGGVTSQSVPACSTTVAPAPPLPVTPQFVRVPGAPFGVVAAPEGTVFVAPPNEHAVAVLHGARRLKLQRTVMVRRPSTPLGLALSANGKRLYAADDVGVTVLGVPRVEQGEDGSVLRSLSDHGSDPIEVVASRSGRYVFVSDEYSGSISVFDLAATPRRALVGAVPVPPGPVGLALSADGRYLFATTELGMDGQIAHGTISVIDAAKATTDPAHALIRSIPAGCSPVRLVVSPDGRTVWVTDRGSNAVVAFDSQALIDGSAKTPLAVVPVGAAPVGLALLRDGSLLAAANSNRFGNPSASWRAAATAAPCTSRTSARRASSRSRQARCPTDRR
jgi:DNA-binding beta-propeller fold protein YncE